MSTTNALAPIPITILTGFLGSGKTTLLLSLLPQLPAGYKLCLLKNEFGDVAVDSQLAAASSITGVAEMNGCICCNLVGQVADALLELKNTYNPTRIVIESSGSAFPATLVMRVKEISRENGGIFTLDGVIQVIDVENFLGYADTNYADTSFAAQAQAKFTDLIVLNKWEVAGEDRENKVLDRIGAIWTETPYMRAAADGSVDKDVIFGIDSSLAREFSGEGIHEEHDHTHSSEVDVLSLTLPASPEGYVDPIALKQLLDTAPKDEVYRIKGIMRFRVPPPMHPDTPISAETPTTPPVGNKWVLNWAFGRWRFTAIKESSIVTTIKGSDTATVPTEFPPSPSNDELKPIEVMPRKGSIEVMVQTSIKTVVEEKVVEAGDCARLSFVLSRGSGRRWKKLLSEKNWIRYDTDIDAQAKIETIA
ncbi:CobW/HypB/UreG, nucleotide-binding domain-containing protein [Pyronema domesticum]|uniref:Similar to Uncharacterized GTP-binding protein YjiA acc. no. P24203 n=1 Tax=Pyronema omphalodes (strain CBS 100304) TaxID=1076935 RepID=U4L528_PYROM|nr:CobW/HypB/UreG, nucleotide-binding domain-containing protein [Pyronema domesticum]CCX12162.1 Similar to Uncharacterized GTP-binding protein YjiA; acc. no. P24203 [Pyronema omphalodes CBS 100304]